MKTIVKKIASSKNNIKKIEKVLLSINKKFKLPVDEFNTLMIAISEVVMNAIVHGNQLDKNKFVTITIEFDQDNMKIRINDEGKGFDYSKTPDPTIQENIHKTSGRGMFIVKSLLKDVKYKHSEEGSETIISIKKKKTIT